ncbi:MAG TPA: ABC transporter ATP-binding protein [Firmicutes bacterium]|nr:ABC transporter ATP-binding protein [Bacillota bacterium]
MGTSRIIECDLREKLFLHLETLSQSFYNKHKTGDLMAHATNDVMAVRQALGNGVLMTFDAISLILMSFVLMMRTNPSLTLYALLPFPIIIFVSIFLSRMIGIRFRVVQEEFANLTDTVQENISGMRVIKAFVQEEKEIEHFKEANKKNMEAHMSMIKISNLMRPLIMLAGSATFIVVIWYGGKLVIDGTIMFGDLMAFTMYLGNMTWPLLNLGWLFNLINRSKASMLRLWDLFSERPEVRDTCITDQTLKDIEGEIEFKNLTFAYPNKEPVLKDINWKIKKGSKVAIIGRTGSGKTTIAQLLMRVYDPKMGELLIDGRDIFEYPLKTLRDNIACVPQDNFLFSATIAQNIAFGKENASFDEVVESSKLAGVYDNIIEFPDKFETRVGERGVTLSGGQKQRVSIARALIRNAPILILDDSLSAVDTATEELILENLRKSTDEQTVIIIAHRISTIEDCDEIIVLENGTITERGTHNELVSLGGFYAELYEKQLLEEQIRDFA